jgi:acetate kinase
MDGIAHAAWAEGYASATGRRLADTRLITLHVGNGCSGRGPPAGPGGGHVRELYAVCTGREWRGLQLDPERHTTAVGLAAGRAARMSHDTARLAASVVAADEEPWIARETLQCVQHANHPQR